MRGLIIDFGGGDSAAMILGNDDRRYRLDKSEWKSTREPKVGQQVDFIAGDNLSAKEVFAFPPIAVKGYDRIWAEGIVAWREEKNSNEPKESSSSTVVRTGPAKVAEITEKPIPDLVAECKFVAVLRQVDELSQLGVDNEDLGHARAQATAAVLEAQGLAERGDQLLAAKRPARALKEFNRALEVCADLSNASIGAQRARHTIVLKNAAVVAGLIVFILFIVMFGMPAVVSWRDGSSWEKTQVAVKYAGTNQQLAELSYRRYLSAVPRGDHVPDAQQALARLQQARQIFDGGMTNEANGDFAGALAEYNKAIELNPQLVDQKWRQKLVDKIREQKLAAEENKRRLANQQSEQLARIERAVQSYNHGITNEANGNLAGALVDYNKAMELNPDASLPYCSRGQLKEKTGDLAGAAADYAKAIGLNPGNSEPYLYRSLLRQKQGDWPGALADDNRFIELNTNNYYAYVGRASVKYHLDDLTGALADLSKAVEIDPNNPDAYRSRGELKNLKDDLVGALADYDKAIELKPDYVRVYVSRAVVKKRGSDWAGALVDYNKAIELTPNDAESFFQRGDLKYLQNDFAGALADLNKAIELKPDLAASYNQRRLVKLNIGDLTGALTDYDKAIELDSKLTDEEWRRMLINTINQKNRPSRLQN